MVSRVVKCPALCHLPPPSSVLAHRSCSHGALLRVDGLEVRDDPVLIAVGVAQLAGGSRCSSFPHQPPAVFKAGSVIHLLPDRTVYKCGCSLPCSFVCLPACSSHLPFSLY
ncbi:hypothetical protein PFLUV_G00255800 [Perca fluviatilis]|uniref:Uncharacterized protein n=1 Tax=Perca fluviatilis TaxID=8168 RepID=A0A6A5E4A5_PERFL|nr:hypothetical protein PFLUV_G00255800 [Perca fluviatilis]